jgi:3-oxoacyl-[acyl-carrier-protein] synthase II
VNSILGAGCSTAAGLGVAPFIAGLYAGSDFLAEVDTSNWKVKPAFEPRAFRWRDREDSSVRALLVRHLGLALDEALWGHALEGTYGVILASTKGFTEDFVWSEAAATSDPLTPILDDVIAARHLKPSMRICVSNACASSLAAVSLAQTWLTKLDHVIVLACDAVDSFVLHGFAQLRVLTTDRPHPFSGDRSGFYLGDAAACVILSRKIATDIRLIDSTFDSEGYAVTRPSLSGDSLLRACLKLRNSEADVNVKDADLVIAHGTATRANDETEDNVFKTLFENRRPLITGTKWMLGHTLGTSGLLDLIVARESLRAQTAPSIMTTSAIDPTFKGNYVIGPAREIKAKTALVTSLGFGGVHAAAWIGRS